MPITYIERDTASDLADKRKLLLTTAASIEISITLDPLATIGLDWVTDPGEPNLLDWQGGTYTWELEVLTAGLNMSMTEVALERISSDGAIVRATIISVVAVSLATTGVKTGTITWNDGTQNPAGRQQDDRLLIRFTITNESDIFIRTVGLGTNTTNNELSTPLERPVVRVSYGDGFVFVA